jgi:hypothetical protein
LLLPPRRWWLLLPVGGQDHYCSFHVVPCLAQMQFLGEIWVGCWRRFDLGACPFCCGWPNCGTGLVSGYGLLEIVLEH